PSWKSLSSTIWTHTFSRCGWSLEMSMCFCTQGQSKASSAWKMALYEKRPNLGGMNNKFCLVTSPCQLVVPNLIVIYFSVATHKQRNKFTADEFSKGLNVFFLVEFLYGAPGQVLGHPNNELCLWIMIFPYLLMNNGRSLLILISSGGAIVRKKDFSIVPGDYRKFLVEPTPKK
ncbi:putative signal peptide protein, partial [Puccinia sorghi]